MALDTQPLGVLSSPNSLSNFSQLALSSDLAGVAESLLMHSSTEAFICAKLKYSDWKTLLSSVRWGANVDRRKAAYWNFCFHSRSKTTHIASFLSSDSCFSAAQIATMSLLTLTSASLDNHLVLNARCNCRPLVLVVWCIARQANRNGETVKHFHNCSVFAVLCTALYKSAEV